MTTRSLRKLPTHCVLVAYHVNCPQHDEPYASTSMVKINNGLWELVKFIAVGFNDYKIMEIMSFDIVCPTIHVSETYENHNVSKITIAFEAEDSGWFLGPWTVSREGFHDNEGNGVTEDSVARDIKLWSAHKRKSDLAFLDLLKNKYAKRDRSAYTLDIPLHAGTLNVYKQDFQNGVLSMDACDAMRFACKATSRYGIVIGDHDDYSDEFWMRINEYYAEERPDFVCKNYFLFDTREEAEKLFSIMDRYFEKRILCVMLGNDGCIEDENT